MYCRTLVLPEGPPPVNNRTCSNTLNEPITDWTARKKVTGFTSGMVIRKKQAAEPAPRMIEIIHSKAV